MPVVEAVTQPIIQQAIGRMGNYYLINRIGYGASCKVYLGYNSESKKYVAIKVPRTRMDAKDFVSLMKVEINTMKHLHHPNIIGLLDFGDNGIV